MAYDDKRIQPTKVAYLASGSALGTSSIIDTSAYKYIQFTTIGTTGSQVVKLHSNMGTLRGSSETNLQYLIFIGSHTCEGAAGGEVRWDGGSITGDQSVFEYGTTANGTFTTFYQLYD